MENSIVPSSLEVTNMTYAEEQYGDFVDIHNKVLTMSEFQKRRNLPLNEQCASVFYSKTAHLTDNDFVEIDRSVLQMIGFKNNFSEQKDKHGNLKTDALGNPLLKDMRNDFSSAVRCLRNTVGFIEGSSLDDYTAHFVIQKLGVRFGTPSSHAQHGGQNKQSLWIRMRALEHFIIMANTCNSFLIREYFLDLKRIMTEYNMYQMVYRAKHELCIKDSTIGELRNDIHTLIKKSDYHINQIEAQTQQLTVQTQEINMQRQQLNMQSEQLNVQTQQLNVQSQKLEMLSNILMKETDNKVIDVNEKLKKQELVVLRSKNEPTQIEVLRGQLNHVNNQLKRKRNDMEVVGKIDGYKNPINLLNRFNESIKKEGDDRFLKSNNKIVLMNGSTAEDLMHVFRTLDEDKHTVANNVKECL